jgi:hypothetical protein
MWQQSDTLVAILYKNASVFTEVIKLKMLCVKNFQNKKRILTVFLMEFKNLD